MHLKRKFLDIVHVQVSNALVTLSLGNFGQTSDANQERSFAHTLLMLRGEELEEVSDGGRAVKGFFKAHWDWKFKF